MDQPYQESNNSLKTFLFTCEGSNTILPENNRAQSLFEQLKNLSVDESEEYPEIFIDLDQELNSEE